MRICLIAEGSYPYVLGGVSSWVQTIINSCPDHEFIIYAIGSDSKKKGQYKYKLPENVVDIIEIFLDEIELSNGERARIYNIKNNEEQALKALMNGEQVQWNYIFDFFHERKFKNISEFFMSKSFYDIVRDVYAEKYPYTPFTEFLWNIRSMYVVLFYILMNPVPKADIYHSVATGYSGIVGIYGKYLYGSSCIISEHGIYTREREEEIIKSSWIKSYHKDIWIKFFHSLSKCAYDNSDIVTSLFETNKELQIEFGCNEDKIKIIPNGVELKKYENLPTRQKDGGIKIGAIVRVVPIKDIRTMLLSFNLVKEQVENARLYIMGPEDEDEEYYNECLNLVQNLHIKDVFFTGSVNVLDYIWDMDILLLTSISEGQPLAVMEGMAARKPYVCTNVGHCKGLIYGDNDEFGRAGFIQYVMDYKGIAQSLIKLGNDEKLRNDMGICGYNRIKNLYTKEGFINEYRDLYNRYGGE